MGECPSSECVDLCSSRASKQCRFSSVSDRRCSGLPLHHQQQSCNCRPCPISHHSLRRLYSVLVLTVHLPGNSLIGHRSTEKLYAEIAPSILRYFVKAAVLSLASYQPPTSKICCISVSTSETLKGQLEQEPTCAMPIRATAGLSAVGGH